MKIIKQPNGKYCCMGTTATPDFYNLTEQDVIEYYTQRAIRQAKEDIKNASNPGELIKAIEMNLRFGYDRPFSDEELKMLGFDKSYDELVKFVPRKPISQSYAACDFTTYGTCPSCGERVQDGMGHKDEKCPKCNQILRW